MSQAGTAVAPFAGVWIEISHLAITSSFLADVAPFAGVWIEIWRQFVTAGSFTSHPSRVCGLKSHPGSIPGDGSRVAPFAGVWIEIQQ